MEQFLQPVSNFVEWRQAARLHLNKHTEPSRIAWQTDGNSQHPLFPVETASADVPVDAVTLPRAFLDAAKLVGRHSDPSRWSLLYRIAWRILNENRKLLYIETDDDISRLALMRKSVERDIYTMRAFVRFRRVVDEGGERYVAWYRPQHQTLDANERFFVERFAGMRWAILTPTCSMMWDLKQVTYGPGAPRSAAPQEDALEELWRDYYRSIYNPARLNLDAMRAQLPVYRWEDLPESRAIPELVRESRARVESMVREQPTSASALVPAGADLVVLEQAMRGCRACELCSRATQAVFGRGDHRSRILLVGEQPGDEEDRTGQPFVGPAGQVLNTALEEAGLDRQSVYMTNAVKAFRFEERGKRRIHQTPGATHVATCRPWLEAEIAAVQPSVIVCLGASAALSVLGRKVVIRSERGRIAERRWGAGVVVTYHPSAVLCAPDPASGQQIAQTLQDDLRMAALAVAQE